MSEHQAFPALLRELRGKAALTQAELGRALGLKDGTMISRYESGDAQPGREQLEKIITILGEAGIPPDQLSALRSTVLVPAPAPGSSSIEQSAARLRVLVNEWLPAHQEAFMNNFGSLLEVYEDLDRAQRYREAWRPADALRFLEVMETRIRRLHDSIEYDFHQKRADAAFYENDYSRACRDYVEAIMRLTALNDTLPLGEKAATEGKEAELRIKLGSAFRRAGEWDEAEKEFNRALAILQERCPDSSAYANALRKRAGMHLYRGQLAEAKKLLDESLRISKQIGDHRNRYKALQHLGWYYHLEGKWKEAQKQHEKAIELIEGMTLLELERKWELMRSYTYLGNYCLLCAEFEKGLAAFQKAKELLDSWETEKAVSHEVLVAAGLARTHFYLSEKAGGVREEERATHRRAATLQARKHRSLCSKVQAEDRVRQAINLYDYGWIAWRISDDQRTAPLALKKAKDEFRRLRYVERAGEALAELGEYYLEHGKTELQGALDEWYEYIGEFPDEESRKPLYFSSLRIRLIELYIRFLKGELEADAVAERYKEIIREADDVGPCYVQRLAPVTTRLISAFRSDYLEEVAQALEKARDELGLSPPGMHEPADADLDPALLATLAA